MAGKLRPISDVNWRNNEAYTKAYLDKLQLFATATLKHASFKALILYNYLLFRESMPAPDDNADIAAYQAAVYGNSPPKKGSSPKFPTYNKEILAKYLSLPRRGAVFSAKEASDKAAGDPQKMVMNTFAVDALPELKPIGDDTEFVQRALGYFFLVKFYVKCFIGRHVHFAH